MTKSSDPHHWIVQAVVGAGIVSAVLTCMLIGFALRGNQDHTTNRRNVAPTIAPPVTLGDPGDPTHPDKVLYLQEVPPYIDQLETGNKQIRALINTGLRSDSLFKGPKWKDRVAEAAAPIGTGYDAIMSI